MGRGLRGCLSRRPTIANASNARSAPGSFPGKKTPRSSANLGHICSTVERIESVVELPAFREGETGGDERGVLLVRDGAGVVQIGLRFLDDAARRVEAEDRVSSKFIDFGNARSSSR